MGSVISYEDCPNCGQAAFVDFYYKTGEEYVGCQHCGYTKSIEIVRDGKEINNIKDVDFKVNEIAHPYGAYSYKEYGTVGFVWGSIATEDDATQFMLKTKDNPNLEYAYINRYVNGKHIKEVIVNNGPEFDSAGFSISDREEQLNK